MRHAPTLLTVALIVGLAAQDTLAQRTSNASSRTSGGTLSGGTRTFSAGSGGGGLGSSGNFGAGTAGVADSSDRFMRDNRQGAFVGSDAGDAASFVGSVAAANQAAQAARNIRRGGGGAANVNQGTGGGRQSKQVRTTLRVGFQVPQANAVRLGRTPPMIADGLADRIERSNWIQNLSPLQVQVDQGTATLRGVVASDHDRVLAERVALLEGGIWNVKNELQVQTPPDQTEPPALLSPESSSAGE